MSASDFEFLRMFPEGALLIDRGRVAACNAMARHYLPLLEEGAPVPMSLPLDKPDGAGTFTSGPSTYSYSCHTTAQGRYVFFRPAPQTALTDAQLDGALRQLRQFMGEFLVELPSQPAGGEAAAFHKSFYRMFRLLDNLEYMHQPAPFCSTTMDLAGLCHQTVQEAAPLLEEAGACLDYESTTTSLLIPGDPALLRRALLELMANSARPAKGGHMLLRLRTQGGRAVLTLSDSGSAPTQRQIAAMLQQDADQYLPAPGAGAGLGLSIVRHIVAQHQGSLLVQWGADGAPSTILSLPTGPLDPRAAVHTPTVQAGAGLSPLLVALSDVLPTGLFGQVGLD